MRDMLDSVELLDVVNQLRTLRLPLRDSVAVGSITLQSATKGACRKSWQNNSAVSLKPWIQTRVRLCTSGRIVRSRPFLMSCIDLWWFCGFIGNW